MPGPDAILEVVREWVVKAESDLKTAVITLGAGRDCPTDTVCFHSEQCVEKYLKALLTLWSIPFPKTHNIRFLLELMPSASRPELERAWQDQLTDYAAAARYPGWGPIPLSEARRAVAVARRVRREIRRLLPRKAKTEWGV